MLSLDREVYAIYGDVSIYHVADEDHTDYIELKRQLNGEDSLFINPRSKDIMWQSVMESKLLQKRKIVKVFCKRL